MRRLIRFMDPEEFRQELRAQGITELRRDYIRRTKKDLSGGYLVLTAEKDGTIYRHEVLLIVELACLWHTKHVQEKVRRKREEAERWLRKFFRGFTIKPGIIVR